MIFLNHKMTLYKVISSSSIYLDEGFAVSPYVLNKVNHTFYHILETIRLDLELLEIGFTISFAVSCYHVFFKFQNYVPVLVNF